jgi:four helix bundle protein
VYKIDRGFPKHELLFNLSTPSAAASVPANFAEGFRKVTKPDKLRFYGIALSSLEECRYYVRLSKDLHYVETGN